MSGAAMTAARPGTTAQHALESLRAAIVAGDLRPGERVRQDDVAERLGVSLAPVREALAVLEQEGQLTYRPRRGYVVTELSLADVREIYELRQLLESLAARRSLPLLDDDARQRIELAARDCELAAERGDVAAELEANRRFHLGLLEAAEQPHTLRVIRLLWDSTETYRAMYYNAPESREEAAASHERILTALHGGDPERLVAELDAHRGRGLARLESILPPHPG
ncbi:MAG: GntR family transcriptional regulator [Solirubrobacterales bacterium]